MDDQGRRPFSATQLRLLDTAERLYAEHGLAHVSNRQIGEAAGQGNTAAVTYHFGTRTGLILAIVRRHAAPIEQLRHELLAGCSPGAGPRDLVACLVLPLTRHLDQLGSTGQATWYARFSAQLLTDPQLHRTVVAESLTSPATTELLERLGRSLPVLPPAVRLARGRMASSLLVHTTADQERALADGSADLTWAQLSDHLADALVGLLEAPAHINTP
ncbi:TetR/AcrR family transcriptional regulator [Kineosporia sp. J2-2]|uniref:TetR/AcrR family transcriptional regulator n=1 Tax=Kineosporia corallincola TaxID=2835133 RepID=A0ABS5TCD8_9ACTN|nr:TetR/AcrR family transcriptional regulator [Kineosporia corallincola]MBT0768747.1 TetR/AcrR family transcriptional regulator [Kineosporia corallincola]